MLTRHRLLWANRASDFLADSGSSSAEYLKAIAKAGFTHWSVSYNRMFYAIAALAYNLMKAVQLICLPDECQGWMMPTLLKQIVRLPATLVRHARRLVARVEVAVSWLRWWQNWEQHWWPAVGAGRPAG